MSYQIELDQRWVNHLKNLPETGMGSQRVDLILKSGKLVPNITVFNCQHIVLDNIQLSLEEINDIRIHIGEQSG
jgi:hypothetical protein